VRAAHPEVVFLAEAFTTPARMRALAKVGFNQSYTYFTWKNTRAELTDYLRELAGPMSEYARPNFFVNTPDILSAYLQVGGRPAFEARLVLAATLSPSYGIYSGFERFESTALAAGSEEYLDSEKYQLHHRTLEGPLLPLVRRLNEIRRANRCLQQLTGTTFLETENEQLLAYARRSDADVLIVCVNLDPFATQEGLSIVPSSLELADTFTVQDLLSGQSYLWRNGGNYVRLGPGQSHIMQVR
jgi:starch synthase (maltosyl-transferring)